MSENNTTNSMASIADPNELNQPLAFILDVQTRFEPDRMELYHSFLNAFKEYQTAAMSAESKSDKEKMLATLRERVKNLLKDDLDLLSEFESFMPVMDTEDDERQQ